MSSNRNAYSLENINKLARAHLSLIQRNLNAVPEILKSSIASTIPELELWLAKTLNVLKQNQKAIDEVLANLHLPDAIKQSVKDNILAENKAHIELATPLIMEFAYKAHYYKISFENLLSLTVYLITVLGNEQLEIILTKTLGDYPQDSTDPTYLETLIMMGRNINKPLNSARQFTPLHYIIYSKSEGLAEYFINTVIKDNPIDYTVKDAEGTTLLILAAKMLKVSLIVSMLRHPGARATINEKDIYGRTALHYAYALGQKDLIGILQKTDGIDLTVVDLNGIAPCEYLTTEESFVRSLLESVDINPKRYPFAQHNGMAFFMNEMICAPHADFNFDQDLTADINQLQRLLAGTPLAIGKSNYNFYHFFMTILFAESRKAGIQLPEDLKTLWGKNFNTLTKMKNYPADAPSTILAHIMKNRDAIYQQILKTIEADVQLSNGLRKIGLFAQSAMSINLDDKAAVNKLAHESFRA
jgi:hypothetical protein